MHSKLGLSGVNDIITVGVGGKVSDLSDVAALATAPTLLDTITATSIAESGSGKHYRITNDTASAIIGTADGDQVGIRIGGAGNPILQGDVALNANGILRLKNPLDTGFTSLQVDVYHLSRTGVYLLPGTELTLTVIVTNLPTHTTLFGIPGTVRIQSEAQYISLADDTNEMRFFGIEFGSNRAGVNKFSLKLANGGIGRYATDQYIDTCTIFSSSDDGIYTAGTAQGGVHLFNSDLYAHYDCLRLSQHRLVNVFNNNFNVWAQEFGATECAAIALGASTPDALLEEKYVFNNNTVKAWTRAIITDAPQAKGIDIRNQLGSNAECSFIGNDISCIAESGAGDAICISVGASGTNTPKISAKGNTLSAVAHGTGNAYTLDSTNANYPILRAGNEQVAGTLGANTTTLTTV